MDKLVAGVTKYYFLIVHMIIQLLESYSMKCFTTTWLLVLIHTSQIEHVAAYHLSSGCSESGGGTCVHGKKRNPYQPFGVCVCILTLIKHHSCGDNIFCIMYAPLRDIGFFLVN